MTPGSITTNEPRPDKDDDDALGFGLGLFFAGLLLVLLISPIASASDTPDLPVDPPVNPPVDPSEDDDDKEHCGDGHGKDGDTPACDGRNHNRQKP